MIPSITKFSIECHLAGCCFSECYVLFIIICHYTECRYAECCETRIVSYYALLYLVHVLLPKLASLYMSSYLQVTTCVLPIATVSFAVPLQNHCDLFSTNFAKIKLHFSVRFKQFDLEFCASKFDFFNFERI